MVGYKAFDKDFKCKNMQYKVGKKYTFERLILGTRWSMVSLWRITNGTTTE